MSPWKGIALCMIIVILPWALYVNFHPKFDHIPNLSGHEAATTLGQIGTTTDSKTTGNTGASTGQKTSTTTSTATSAVVAGNSNNNQTPKKPSTVQLQPVNKLEFPDLPVQGPIPTNGAVPLFGVKHKGTDAIFALACNYPTIYYKRFVGSLRKFGYTEDIVLAVSPVVKMKPGVEAYVKETNVVAYGFDVDCKGTDNCQLKDEFLGYPDPRPHRTFANIRYALYEYWLMHYSDASYILILDFRDTFFQGNPFQAVGTYAARSALAAPKYDLQMYAENYKVSS